MRAALLAVALVAAAAPAGGRQGPPPSPQPSVTFKVDVRYVEVDAIVTDGQGRPVTDLTREEFQLFEEGKPQTVSAFTRVDLPVARPDPPLFRTTAVEPDAWSNRAEFDGRVFLIVLDDLQTDFRRTARVKAAARQFVSRFVGANDLVAVVTTGGRNQAAQEFTTSHRRLLAAIDRFMGQKIPSATMATIDDFFAQRRMGAGQQARDTLDAERSFKARNTLSSLQNLAGYLNGIRGRRKAIVWFGEGIDYDVNNPFVSRDATTIRQEMQDAIAAATRANVSIYGIDARGLGAGLDEQIDLGAVPDDPGLNLGMSSIQAEVRRAQDSLREISGETGGFAIVNTNDLNEAFGRIIQDHSTYYLLGYYPADDKRDGRFRSVQVRVTRPGLSVRARRGYAAPKGRVPAAAAATATPPASPALRDALASPIPSAGVRFDASAALFMGKGSKASVFIVLEIDPAALRFTRQGETFTDEVEIVSVAADENGKIQDGGRDEVPLRLGARTHAAVSQSGFRFTRRLELPPGRYQLRVGIRTGGQPGVGSLAFDLDVPDFTKGPLGMSGITVTAGSASRITTANPDPAFKDVLPSSPAAARTFARTDTLALFAEVYDNVRAPAHAVSIRTSITADSGATVFSADDQRRSEELGGATGAYGHVRQVPLQDLAPGRYVLRVEATSSLGQSRAARELEFRVR